MLGRRERAGADLARIGRDGALYGAGDRPELFHELGHPGGEAQHVLHDQDLPVTGSRCPDADGRDGGLARDAGGKGLRHGLEHDGKGTCLGHDPRILLDRRPLVLGAPLRLEAAEHVDGLRRQADVGHHRHAPLGEKADGLGHAPSAFELDGTAVGLLHDAGGVAERDRRALLVSAEGHVDHDQGAPGATHDGTPVHDHEIERHGNRRFVTVHHHAEAIAHEEEIHIGVRNAGRVRVIGGERHDGLAALAGGDLGRRDAPGRGLRGHGGSQRSRGPAETVAHRGGRR